MKTAEKDVISEDILGRRMPAVGHVKIGGKRPQSTTSSQGKEFQLPVRYDHFKIRKRTRGDDGNYLLDEAVHEVVGPEPKVLDVRLPFDTRAENLYAKMVEYSGQTRVKQCDGREYHDPRKHEPKPEVCARKRGRTCNCKPYARLALMLEAAPTFGGVYVFRTTSWETVATLQTVLGEFEETFGSLRGLPLRFELQAAEKRYRDSEGKERITTAYIPALVLRASFDEAREAALEFHRANRIARSEIRQIAGATVASLDELDQEEAGEINDEFFPDSRRLSPPADPPPAETNGEGGEVPPEDEGDDAPGEPIDRMIQKLRGLVDDAEPVLTEKNLESIEGAISRRDESQIRTAIDFVEARLPDDSTDSNGDQT